MNISRILGITLLACSAAYGAAADPLHGNTILSFQAGHASVGWSVIPDSYVVDERGGLVERPAIPAIKAGAVSIAGDDRRYAGQGALRVRGVIDSRCGMLEMPSPFDPPMRPAGALEDSARLHPLQGYLYRAGFVESVSIEIRNDGDPVTLGLLFENDAGGFYACEFEIGSAPGAWFLYSHGDAQYSYVRDASVRAAVKFDWLRLAAIQIRSPRLVSAIAANSAKVATMTDEQKSVWAKQPAPASKPLEIVDLSIRRILVKQEFQAPEESGD